MKKTFSFDPPLAVPGHGGTARIEAANDVLDPQQPDIVQVEICDGGGERLALGLFKQDLSQPGLYRLFEGSACTHDEKGIRIQRI